MDAQALAEPEVRRPTYETVSATVLGWVREMLEDESVSPADNFLDVGGHSMFAVDLNEKAVETFGAELDIEVLFREPLERALAVLAEAAQAQPEASLR